MPAEPVGIAGVVVVVPAELVGPVLGVLHAVSACVRALPDGIVFLMICTQTRWSAAVAPATFPDAALSHTAMSWFFSDEDSVGTAWMLALHLVTAAATSGDVDVDVEELFEALVVLDAAAVFVELDVELLPPPPQPAIRTPPMTATAHNPRNPSFMSIPSGHPRQPGRLPIGVWTSPLYSIGRRLSRRDRCRADNRRPHTPDRRGGRRGQPGSPPSAAGRAGSADHADHEPGEERGVEAGEGEGRDLVGGAHARAAVDADRRVVRRAEALEARPQSARRRGSARRRPRFSVVGALRAPGMWPARGSTGSTSPR